MLFNNVTLSASRIPKITPVVQRRTIGADKPQIAHIPTGIVVNVEPSRKGCDKFEDPYLHFSRIVADSSTWKYNAHRLV